MMSGIRLISGCHNRTPAPSARNIIKKFRKIAATGMASVVCPETKAQNKGPPPQSPGSRHVAVFEAPIDALSHATLQELEGWKWNGYRLSLGGTSHVALTSFLERHPEIRRVTLYMDHDLAGFVNARKIKTMLHEDKRFRHIRVSVNPPRMGKDYNEKLLLVREQLQTSQHQRRPKEAAVSI